MSWRSACLALLFLGPCSAGVGPPTSEAPAAVASVSPQPSAPPMASAILPVTRTCGARGLPDCPLQQWMKGNASTALSSRNAVALSRAFSRIVEMAPPGYIGWAEIAADGQRAAAAGDFELSRAACKQCHSAHRPRYVIEWRSRPL